MIQALTARYRPATIGPHLVVALTAAFAVLTLTRGLTWARSPDPDAVGEVLATTAFGLTVWGVLLIVGAALLLAAMAARLHLAVWCSHALLASTYVGITVAVFGASVSVGDGYSAVVAPLGGTVWHTFLNYRMRPVVRHFPPHVSEVTHGRRAGR